MKIFRFSMQFLFLLLFALCCRGMAQSTIFNIPSTDTVAPGKFYAEFSFLPQIPAAENSRTYLYNPRVVVGLPGRLEIGLNFPITNFRGDFESSTNGYIQPNAKWRAYENEKAGIALAAGGLLNTPLNNRDDQDSWGLLYGLFSKKVKTGDYGPRFHAGPYGIVGANQDIEEGPVSFSGPRAGVILGYEQPVHKRVSIIADWFSGKNSFGYFTPGITVALPRNGLLNIGYSFGNDSWEDSNATKNRFLFIYYGIVLP